MPSEAAHGLDIRSGQGITRINLGCEHQRGMLYIVPAEKSWVCSAEMLPGHALAGFLGELVGEKDERVSNLMQKWGIYFRQMPLEKESGEKEGAS
jgi:hypothetical protein